MTNRIVAPLVRQAPHALPYAAIAIGGTIAFLPGLSAGFVSDDFNFLAWAADTPFQGMMRDFIPTPHFWYRPINDLIFWLEWRAFGYQPVAYHIVTFVCHLAIGFLLYRLIRRLGIGTAAALIGTAAFALSIHAHELIFWWADAHYAFAGLAVVGAILAYVEGVTWLSLLLTIVALLSDEASVTVLPVLAAYQVVFRRGPSLRQDMRQGIARLAPYAGIEIVYGLLRLAGGGFWSESPPCHSARCETLGMLEYFDRLFLRPEQAIELLGVTSVSRSHLLIAGGGIVLVLLLLGALLHAGKWQDWRVVAFGATWSAIAVAVFVWGLWPYVSDRFLYYPELGLAVALAGIVGNALRSWVSATRSTRLTAGGALAVIFVWLAAGVPVLWHRASQWQTAGRVDAAIFDQTYRLEPDPPRGTAMVFLNVPDSLKPSIPPGNTGPYLLRNGLTTGMRLRYGRPDVLAIPAKGSIPAGVVPVCMRIQGSDVVAVECPQKRS